MEKIEIEDFSVDCISDKCIWTGLASQCITRRWPNDLICPSCKKEKVEPVHEGA